MTRNRPRIAVTTSVRSSWRIFPMFALNIWFAGGRAVRWTSARPRDLDDVDGVVIGGGDDISPDIYGGSIVSSARLDHDRDAMERALVLGALARHMPLLGVCRGAQMINVALGGSLWQDAYGVYTASERRWTVLPRKSVVVEPNTRLARIAGNEEMRVNALHHQAVDRLGSGLQIAARDRGGMIQAVERVEAPFMLGVQWHPEHLIYAKRQRALFRALVQAVQAKAVQVANASR
ncbi:MAG: gamma-glutamyl-gamma-aminobutyrate hydrolase family protein [Rhodobacteraceae bacterium]|nr:gamma-glutamyl-gamma-aminobutyrate hydrolase family protein [Paracoccaceae bacterium]